VLKPRHAAGRGGKHRRRNALKIDTHPDALATRFVGIMKRSFARELKRQPRAYLGYIIPSSWNPKDGTVQVRVKHTAYMTAQANGIDLPLDPIRIPLLTAGLGHQYGPQGYEDVTVIPRADRWVAIFEHNDITTPGAPAGEHWLVHYTSKAVIDLWIKFTNTTGVDILAGPLFHMATKNGLAINADDSTGILQLGATNLSTTQDAVATQRYVQQQIVQAFNAHEHTGVQTGSGTSGTPVTPMPTFSGSATVLAKP
jgi:hypothetical protein